MLPGRVIHADWSATPRKRWMCEAVLGADGRYCVSAPRFIRDAGLFALTLMTGAAGGVLVGFDFPIGLPLSYARRAGIESFLSALPQFGDGRDVLVADDIRGALLLYERLLNVVLAVAVVIALIGWRFV